MKTHVSALAGVVLSLACVSALNAQEWPARTVRLIVPASAGSSPDIGARILADKLVGAWGKQIVVDNRPGGNTVIGMEAGARSAPDGYTLLFTHAAALTISPYSIKSLPYDIEKDFVPVGFVGYSPMLITVANDVPAKSLDELIKLAKAQPGKLSFATPNAKNVPHLTGELLNSTAGIRMLHVPYRSTAQAIQDTMGGQVQILIDGATSLVGAVRTGRIRAIALTAAQKLEGMENIPLANETLPGFVISGWFAVVAPAGTPPAVIARVNRDMNQQLQVPDTISRMRDIGVIAQGGSPDALAQTMKKERAQYQKVIRDANIQPD